MGITVSNNLDINAPKAIDSRTGKFAGGAWIPWATTSEAIAGVVISRRYVGLSVRVGTPSSWSEYHWEAGITDEDLVPKTTGSGADGTIWRNGTAAPSNGTGVNGDYFLNTTTGDVYKKASGTYSVVGNIKGPTGATGATGPAGADGSGGGGAVSATFSASVPFTRDYTYMNHTVAGAIAFTPNPTGRIVGGGTYIRLVADGTNAPTFSSAFNITSGAYDNRPNRVNRLIFLWNGYEYELSIAQLNAVLSTPSFSADVISTTQINLTSIVSDSDSTGMTIERATNAGFTTGLTTIYSGAPKSSHNDTGLASSTHYYYRVQTTASGFTTSAYGTDDADTGLITLSTPALTAAVISSSQINLSWTNIANESSYKLEYSLNGTSGWTQIGGTIAANTTAYSHSGLTGSTHYYYRISAIGDGVTYSTSGFGTDDDTTSASPAISLSLVSTAALTESPTGTWNSASGGEMTTSPAKKIGSGTSGKIYSTFDTAATFAQMFGIQTDNLPESTWTDLIVGVYWAGSGNGIRSIPDNILIDNSPVDGYLYGVEVVDNANGTSTLRVIKSTNSGSSWTVIHTQTTSQPNSDFYPKWISLIGYAGKIINPKGQNVV